MTKMQVKRKISSNTWRLHFEYWF